MKSPLLGLLMGWACLAPTSTNAQINSGSDGHDGAFNPTQSVEIDMADHPDGIYHYTTVNIPTGVTVTFKPNAKNTPVVWLVQGDCVIGGGLNANGDAPNSGMGAASAPGGWPGGAAGKNGLGPGGGFAPPSSSYTGGHASHATSGYPGSIYVSRSQPGSIYGNKYLMPLMGGSGGSGGPGSGYGGGGGGGAILIASSGSISVNGVIGVDGGGNGNSQAGCGSGGGVRLVARKVIGTGVISAAGPVGSGNNIDRSGAGYIRFDTLENNFGGSASGMFSNGLQPIIIPAANEGGQLHITSIGGVQIAASPGGVLFNPDVIIPAQLSNPLQVEVNCSNIPLNTDITLKVRPANGTEVVAVGKNTAGTQAASLATIPVNMPRGGGIIFASAVTGLAPAGAATGAKEERMKNLAQTGLTTDGETFVAMEVTAALGGKQRTCYLTESGKRFQMPGN